MNEVTRMKKVVGAISGTVMWRSRWNALAPSIVAASSSSCGIACRPARKMSIA